MNNYEVLSETRGTYNEDKFTIITKGEVKHSRNGNGQDRKSIGFGIRKSQNYTDRTTGKMIEKQPLDLWCTSFVPEVITFVQEYKKGQKCTISGFLEPVWRGYKADSTPSGIRFIVPDTDKREPLKLKDGSTVNPTSTPYFIKDIKGVNVSPSASVRIVQMSYDTDIKESDDIESVDISKIQEQNGMNAPNNPTAEQKANVTEGDPVAEQATEDEEPSLF